MDTLWNLYHPNVPEFLRELSETPALRRLRQVGMNCGCEYTHFPLFTKTKAYSRFDHSMGAALIVWHFTGSVEQAVAALLHDIATPVFAHVVDFLAGDHLRQESTEGNTAGCIAASEELCVVLRRYGLTPGQVSDYHRYPVADNNMPALAADRLEYTLGNLLQYGFEPLERLGEFYGDLVLGTNEEGCTELVFQTERIASEFAMAALQTSRIYVAREDRFAMQALADILRSALAEGVLSSQDLMTTEPFVIKRLQDNLRLRECWTRFCGYSCILERTTPPEGGLWLRVPAKKRWIDPLVLGKGRVSRLNPCYSRELQDFLQGSFDTWLSAE